MVLYYICQYQIEQLYNKSICNVKLVTILNQLRIVNNVLEWVNLMIVPLCVPLFNAFSCLTSWFEMVRKIWRNDVERCMKQG